MKVALLSDIHGNAPALKAVLARVDVIQVDHLLVAGDLVGYYYDPAYVVRTIRERASLVVRGNHEGLLDAWCEGDNENRERLHQRYGSGFKIAADQLSPDDRSWLSRLPHPSQISIDGQTVMVCHGSPDARDQYIYPDANSEERALLWAEDLALTVFGHTHYPVVWRNGQKIAVNPGSVGQPRHGSPGACWALWDSVTGDVDLFNESYDWESVASQTTKIDPHLPHLAEVLSRRNTS
jgi:putative phosphoesterase